MSDDRGEPTSEGASLEALIAGIDQEVAGAPIPPLPAEPPGEPEAAVRERLVVFSLAGSKYAAPVANVVEVGKPLPTTPVPHVPPWLLGVANLRGEVLSVVDLAAYLGVDRTAPPSRLMVVRTGAEPVTAGLLVDGVTGMLARARADLRPPTAPADDRIAPYLAGVYDTGSELVSVLDFDRLLAEPHFRQFEPGPGPAL